MGDSLSVSPVGKNIKQAEKLKTEDYKIGFEKRLRKRAGRCGEQKRGKGSWERTRGGEAAK